MKRWMPLTACGLWTVLVLTAAAQDITPPANDSPAERSEVQQPPAAEEPAAAEPAARELTNAELTTELRNLQNALRTLNLQFGPVADHISDNMQTPQRLSDLEAKMMELESMQQEMLDTLKAIQQSLEQQREQSSGERITTLRPLIEDQDLRRQLAEKLQEEMPKQGLFHIENTTDVDRTIEVNRKEFSIPAKQSRSFRVSVGAVTTQLPGEPLMTWTVAAPSYEQRIQIIPKAEPTVVSRPEISYPAAPSYPVYEGTPWYPW